MSATSVIGLQWGDEAKGKIVDLLSEQHEIVVRYLGGNNAGHTVKFDGKTYKLSLLPAGVLNPNVTSVITGGVVINPKAFLQEMASIVEQNGPIEASRLLISDRAHVIFPYHMQEEVVFEQSRKEKAIGTTMRGIGTCYRDKAGRTHAIRMGDLVRPEFFRSRLEEIVAYKNKIFQALDPEAEPLDVDAIYEEYSGYAEQLKDHVVDTSTYLLNAVAEKKKILFEGAQGSLLDIDHGTFPYVTSSNSSGCGIHNGSGVSERYIDKMIGVVKAYTTRVGGGPFVTELHDEIGQRIRDVGNEYGTVTGRPRRCGWFDAVATRYGANISGVDCIAVMLLDVLSGLDELKICEAYDINGKQVIDFPSHILDLEQAKPVYRTIAGWKEDITGIRKMEDLPENAIAYIKAIEEIIGKPVEIVSVGPDREQTILLK
ncbi:adenylosuccinate synthase [Gimesia maris]|uniref:Adenylosuccinate synthetase n=1 Tax=Gimesia maris TaxID=122 RepID=A0ABX5YIN0_9PLAN|nr:adenylosuccinate synthase [Gimesia maris]EDL58312.1 Adenylosuccinate synthase [Gimesia maris DSM 8797]QEG15484.1 Adenylosuccinate synthetase [Gimesia maris]QGQ31209.1 adenylosuccinate synthase [Gimesia maris]